MNIKKFTVGLLFLIAPLVTFNSIAAKTFGNEREIQFKSGEQSVLAYEGSIQVMENRNNKNSRSIPLTYVRFPATGNKKGAPIVYLSGGPGGSGISTAQYPNFRFPLFMALREFGDVIALDQRGTGKSRIVPKCESTQALPLNERLSVSKISKVYRAAAKECFSFWGEKGADVLGYTTVQSAHDLNDLRKHLKVEKLTLWGISYGTHLALASLKVMENHIDKMILASAEGLDQTVKLPARTDAYFNRLQQAINQQPKAKAVYPDVVGLIKRVHKKIAINPISVTISQKGGKSVEFLFQKSHMQGIAAAMISDPHRYVSMLLQLYSDIDNDITVMLPSVIKRAGLMEPNISLDIMSFGMDIASGISSQRQILIEQQAPASLVGKMLNFPMPHLNKAIPNLDLGDDFRSKPVSDVPTLLLSGTLDGRTYVQSQYEATAGLSNLTKVTVKNAGHNLFMVSPKVTETIKMFLDDKSIGDKEIEFTLPPFLK
ncbi:alpha/beta fold hydrolase [Pseudoalteromonas sp. MMG005]|uniref:alpha/beta fold hydrolase n=1 Tax=Pseudoalteromonas sp. MMG005 TaxID=2822682 RepID=UPI001B3A4238|nr:alpha/beta fold hydrolase [Pseudoalteromonas sp. MMG005]MBQ4848451.1 alpha/beta fold hydrolase [Pseudoalteromonas sp. MMG005]